MIVFKSKIRNYCTSIRVNGSTVRVAFKDRGMFDMYGYYFCTSKKIADVLRQHPSFGDIFFCESTAKEQKSPKPAHVYAAVYPDVTRTQEANRVLSEKYGVDKELLKSKADALVQAETLNIAFPNLK